MPYAFSVDAASRDVIFSKTLEAALNIEGATDANIDLDQLSLQIKNASPQLWAVVQPEEQAFEKAIDDRILERYEPPGLLHRRFTLRRDIPRRRPVEASERLRAVTKLAESLDWESLIGTHPALSEFDTKDMELLSALGQNLLQRSVLPQVREELEVAKGKSYSTNLEVISSPGLGELANPTTEISTSSRDQLVDLLGKMTTATLGIAGPRGAGKTTLLDALANGRVPMDEPFQYRCFVMSPTRYDTREFLLHLTSQLSRQVLGGGRGSLDDGQDAGVTRLLDTLSLLGVGALVVATIAAIAGRVETAIAVGAGIVTLAVAMLIVNRALISTSTVQVQLRRNPIDPIFGLQLYVWRFASVLALSVGVAVLVVEANISPFPLQWFAVGATIAAGFTTLIWVQIVRRRIYFPYFSRWGGYGDYDNLLMASRLLDATSYQLTFSKSLSASFTLNLRAASLGGQSTSGISRAQLPLTLPDIVRQFRDFAESISRNGRTLVCIDELDKIADPDDVEKFLNDVKAVFAIPNCLFVLSVSLDALRSFEKRGLPTRSAVDSSFDEIVRVGYLDWPSARLLHIRRVTGVPVPFWAICFCLSGGLPRDLVRAARMVFRVAGGRPKRLNEIVAGMISIELTSRASGIAGSMLDSEAGLDIDFADWITSVPNSDSIDLWRYIDRFRTLTDAMPPGASSKESRLGELLNFVTFVLLCCTLVQVFTNDLTRQELEDCERASEERAFEKLAVARQQIAVFPANAWRRLVSYRRAWNLTSPRAPVAAWD